MKKKMKGVLGVGLAFVLVASLMVFAIPVAADPGEEFEPEANEWTGYVLTAGSAGYWFIQGAVGDDELIEFIGPIAQAIDGDLYAYVGDGADTPKDLLKSEDGGRTWAASTSTTKSYGILSGDAIVDMVCSSMDEDVLYVTDGNYVYKSVDGGETFALLAPESLETVLEGECGCTITHLPITCLDVGYDGNDNPLVFIGTKATADTPGSCSHGGPPSVLFMAEVVYPVKWNDLRLECYGSGDFVPYAVGATPDFADTGEVMVVVSRTSTTLLDYGSPGTAEWSDGPTAAPRYSVKLSDGGNVGGLGWGKVIIPGLNIPVADIESLSFSFNYHNTESSDDYIPYMCLQMDTENDGAVDYTACVSICSGDVKYGEAFDEDQWETWSLDTVVETSVPGWSPIWHDSDGVIWLTLADVKAKANGKAVTHHGVADAVVLDVEVAEGGWQSGHIFTPNEAYITDITINGVTYELRGETNVVSTSGTICHWTEQAELLWDCVYSFDISDASRIGFPDDWADSETLFVGVVGTGDDDGEGNSYGGDVYSVTAPSAIDLNVAGSTTGCVGLYHADIISLDVVGAADEASLIAGAYDASADIHVHMVYYSTDGGWEWDHCDKAPSGEGPTYALWVGDSAIAATAGTECAISLSCGEEVGEYFNQISLIATDVDQRLDMDHAPGYLTGTSPIFIATKCEAPSSYSVFRYDQTYWERVYVSTLTGFTDIDWVQVSPDFDTTEAVFVANSGFDIFRSVDAGCSWKGMRYPCAPKPAISAWVVVDEDTVLAGGSGSYTGKIYKTTNHGASPWKEYKAKTAGDAISFALSPDIDTDDSVLLGDSLSQVFISEDLGEEWDLVADYVSPVVFPTTSPANTYVIFDPGYGTSGDEGEFMIYAAAGDTIGRCDIDTDKKWSKQNWVRIDSLGDLALASGIAAAGDTALYVADASTVSGPTTGVTSAPGDSFAIVNTHSTFPQVDSALTVSAGKVRLTPSDGCTVNTLTTPVELVAGESAELDFPANGPGKYILVEALVANSWGFWQPGTLAYYLVANITVDADGDASVATTGGAFSLPDVGVSGATAGLAAGGVVRSLNPMAAVTPTKKVVFERLTTGLVVGTTELEHPSNSDDLWLTTRSNVLWALDSSTSIDTLGNPYVTYIWVWEDPLATPVIQETPSDGAQLTSTSKVTLEWEALDDADEYDINLYRYCAECPDEKLAISVDNSTDTCAIIDGLDAGTLYYWQVRVAEGEPFLSKWSELWEFTTALGKVPALCSPVCGGQDIILTTNFSWTAVSGASSYELQIVAASADGTSDFTGAETLTTDVNALASMPGLDYSTTYYWRVRAVKDGVPGAWSVCIFTTEAPPVVPPEPVPPVEIPPLPAPITPMWIWVIIGIGAALTIAVIVLIVTTRRVP